MELIEGNDNPGLQADLFHGTSSLMTGFRNRWDGKDPGSTTGETYTATWTFDGVAKTGTVSGTSVTTSYTFTTTGVT